MSQSTMDPEEFRKFSFEFSDTPTEDSQDYTEHSRRSSRHVKFDKVPKPDHLTGEIALVSPTKLEWKDFNHSAYSTNARRRSSSLTLSELERYGNETRDRRGKRRRPSGPDPEFREVKWQDDIHPGTKIPVDVHEGESVSPRSSGVVVPLWGIDMDAQAFRARIQPSRVTGRRKPGQTARSSQRPKKEVTRLTTEEMHEEFQEEGCVIQ